MTEDFNFIKEEYLTLRKEIEEIVRELRQLERNCVIAVALAFTWIVTQKLDQEFARVAWLIPSLIPIYGAVRSRAIGKHLVVLGQYIKTIEDATIPKDLGIVGWEHYLEVHSPGALNATSKQMWTVLILLSVFVSALGFWES